MSIDWTQPIETVPCAANSMPLPCEVIAGMSDNTHAYVRIGKERVPAKVEGEEDDRDLWFIPGREGDTGKRVGSREWWYLRSADGANEIGLPSLRNVVEEGQADPTEPA